MNISIYWISCIQSEEEATFDGYMQCEKIRLELTKYIPFYKY